MASGDELRTELGKLTKEELIELMIEKQKKTNTNNSELEEALPRKSKIENVKCASPEKKTAKQNTPGLGIEYEVHLPAYFALLLNTNPEIEDFRLRSNVQDFGNLDDLLVDIKTKSGENLYFAFQLKHKENSSKNLLPTNFEARGDFNLEKYSEAFKNLNQENRKYHFILYTNKNFDPSRTNQVKKFDMKQDECCVGRNFFDTSGDSKHLYRFEVNEETEDGKNVNKDDFREFFSKFSLYTGQTNIRDLDKSHILDILKCHECYVKYVDFFRRWHRGDFIDKILDKKTLNIHLIDIFLSSVAINYHFSDGQDGNSKFFETMIQQFDVTIIDAFKQDFIKNLEENVQSYPEEFNKTSEEIIKMGKKCKLIDRFTKELKEETKLKLQHYFFQKPLILDFYESSEDLIYQASKLCKIHENGIKLVILGQDIDVSKFSHLKTFTNLTEVHENFLEETKKRCSLSLQGRNISFEAIFEDEIREFVTPRTLFQMLKGSFSIGGDKESLPEYYIPRTVSTTVFDIEPIIKHSSGSAAFIFYYENKFEELKTLIQKIVDAKDYLNEDFLDAIVLRTTHVGIPTIILRKEECSREQLDEIRERTGKKDVHSFKVIDEKRCLFLMSTNTKLSVEENNIHVFFNDSINILCAQPGMGKSTLMKYLKNEYDPNFWTLRVDLKAHNQFLKGKHKIEDVLIYFLELESCQDLFLFNTKRMFLRKRKIVLFLDGLDEVEIECVDYVLNITRQLSDMGFRIWLSSRQNLQQKIENYFNISAIEIDEINENQQKRYIEKRLTSQYSENEIKEIVEKIFSNRDLPNQRHILEIPLQLHIITQIFLDERSYYHNLSKNNFILTKMLEIFFEGKYKHFVTKLGLKNSHLLGTLEEQFENYELVALHSVLDDKHFQKLQIENFKTSQIKNWDIRLGIITEINSENKAVFEHLTFAEYFASKFLVKNFDKARILREEIFSEKYQNLLLIFNIMLAEDSPLHLAIIYKDLDRIEEMGQSSLVDKGGRNFLQVAACIATRHPLLRSNPEPCSQVNDLPVLDFKGEDWKIKEIVNRTSSSEPFKNDKIFDWNSLDYALVNGALYLVETILEKFEKHPNFYEILEKYYRDEFVAYYSIRFGYHRLLSEILAKKTCHVTKIFKLSFRDADLNSSILNFLWMSDCANRTTIVELLTDGNINKIVYERDGSTFLHFAVFHEDIELVKFLLEKEADVNVRNIRNGWSTLFWAVNRNNFEISKLLVEKGADVNTKDKKGKSPLFLAVEKNNLEITKMLVDKGADVNVNVNDGWSPLFWTVEPNVSKFLFENIERLNIKGKEYGSVVWPLLEAVKHNNSEISKLLIEKGADINIKDKRGRSLLILAVEQNNLEISKLLVERGSDVNIKDEDNRSPLFLAVERNNFEISKLLVEKGADINVKNKYSRSPLFFVKRNGLEISKLLIEKGANVNIKDKNGVPPLLWVIEQNNLEVSKLLIEKGAEVNIKGKNGWSPLLLAVKRNNFEISKLLVEKGADVNIKNKKKISPLFLAVQQHNLEISKLLVEKGADVNIIKGKYGTSPLLSAANRNNFAISKLLVEKGADVNIKDKKYGRSPLFWAVVHENFKLLKFLVEKGADVNIKVKDGKFSSILLGIRGKKLEMLKSLNLNS